MEEIYTARLILRPFHETDYDDLYEFLSQLRDDAFEGYPNITYENGREHLAYRLGSEAFYAVELKDSGDFPESSIRENQFRLWRNRQAQRLAASGKVIGNIYCGDRDYRSKEVGYIINKDYRRKGYALEALRAVIEHAFRSGVYRVYAECDPRNECSWKLLEGAGLVREAHFRQNIFFHRDSNGEPLWKDTYVYAVLCDDAR